MKITTRKPYPWPANVIVAYSDRGHRLEIPYPYWSDDPHWLVAFRLARRAGTGAEVERVGQTGSGYVYVTV